MSRKLNVYLTSNVFSEEEIGSNEKISKEIRFKIKKLWEKLAQISELKYFDGRFPIEKKLNEEIRKFNPDILGCHLSHKISIEMLKNSNIFAVSTSTVGYNHIQRTENDNILITHTPGVLHETVADYTITLILANLRNIVDLHNYVWNYGWSLEEKWDLDHSLSSMLATKILGIVGLGEIGKEIVKKLYSWGVKIIYYDIEQMKEFEKKYPLIEFKKNLNTLFRESDIISLHIPLNKKTHHIINRDLLKLMKKNALLVNTARGSVVDLDTLINMIENEELQINLALDVFSVEPIDLKTIERLKRIKKNQPDIRIIALPHNASADANTRGKMDVIFLIDIIHLIESSSIEDLDKIHLIPEHKKQLKEKKWKIYSYWERK